MGISSLSIIVAVWETYRREQGKETLFYLYCQQEKKLFAFKSLKTAANKFTLFGFDKRNVVAGRFYDFFDYGDKHWYHVVSMSQENIEIINVTLGKFFGARLKDNKYRVLDYQSKEVFDFELINE